MGNRLQKLDKFMAGMITFMVFTFAAVLAMAQVPDLPAGDGLSALLGLVLNYKTMSVLAIGVAVVLILGQLLKQYLPADADGKPQYKRLAMLGLSVIYAVLVSVVGGVGWLPSLILVLITKGGATELYEALKGAGIIKVKAP